MQSITTILLALRELQISKIINIYYFIKMIRFNNFIKQYRSISTNVKKIEKDFNLEPVKLTFNFKIQIARNSFILRFLLPDTEYNLGFPTCQHVLIESEVPNLRKMKKPFQPISSENDSGFIDFLVKTYPKKDNELEYGAFSNHLVSLEVNRYANKDWSSS